MTHSQTDMMLPRLHHFDLQKTPAHISGETEEDGGLYLSKYPAVIKVGCIATLEVMEREKVAVGGIGTNGVKEMFCCRVKVGAAQKNLGTTGLIISMLMHFVF